MTSSTQDHIRTLQDIAGRVGDVGFTDLQTANDTLRTLILATVAVVTDRTNELQAIRMVCDELHARVVAAEDERGPMACAALSETLDRLIARVLHYTEEGDHLWDEAEAARGVMLGLKPTTDALVGRAQFHEGRGVNTLAAQLNHESQDRDLRKMGLAAAERVGRLMAAAAAALSYMDAQLREAGEANSRLVRELRNARG